MKWPGIKIEWIKTALLALILFALWSPKEQPAIYMIDPRKIEQYEQKIKTIDEVYLSAVNDVDSLSIEQKDSIIARFERGLDHYRNPQR